MFKQTLAQDFDLRKLQVFKELQDDLSTYRFCLYSSFTIIERELAQLAQRASVEDWFTICEDSKIMLRVIAADEGNRRAFFTGFEKCLIVKIRYHSPREVIFENGKEGAAYIREVEKIKKELDARSASILLLKKSESRLKIVCVGSDNELIEGLRDRVDSILKKMTRRINDEEKKTTERLNIRESSKGSQLSSSSSKHQMNLQTVLNSNLSREGKFWFNSDEDANFARSSVRLASFVSEYGINISWGDDDRRKLIFVTQGNISIQDVQKFLHELVQVHMRHLKTTPMSRDPESSSTGAEAYQSTGYEPRREDDMEIEGTISTKKDLSRLKIVVLEKFFTSAGDEILVIQAGLEDLIQISDTVIAEARCHSLGVFRLEDMDSYTKELMQRFFPNLAENISSRPLASPYIAHQKTGSETPKIIFPVYVKDDTWSAEYQWKISLRNCEQTGHVATMIVPYQKHVTMLQAFFKGLRSTWEIWMGPRKFLLSCRFPSYIMDFVRQANLDVLSPMTKRWVYRGDLRWEVCNDAFQEALTMMARKGTDMVFYIGTPFSQAEIPFKYCASKKHFFSRYGTAIKWRELKERYKNWSEAFTWYEIFIETPREYDPPFVLYERMKEMYKVDLQSMKQTNIGTGKERQLMNIDEWKSRCGL
eukprot:TRINITY_DN10099_c0_g1_i2.p1 TRINITY_DN10099_c0_g1~~TRINITY_DN10099_c0_g1_i2.p1  ORF type:complete len:649 (+),score=21.91 TRINITY_DN10099_c0_g1_i2:143-2089(+)